MKNKVFFTKLKRKIKAFFSGGDTVNRLYEALYKTTPSASLTSIIVSLVEHCNLNCWGCDHFAPLAEKTFLDISEYEKDITRLSELSKGVIGTIKLMGGEPLLHPDINKFVAITRQHFPQSRIEITTNGILLNKQDDSFWQNCHDNKITVVATKYPLKIKWKTIISKAKSLKVSFEFYNKKGKIKKSHHNPLNLKGTGDTYINFINCFRAKRCIELYHGKLYTCTVIPHACHFNKTFNKNLMEIEEDSINIHNANNMKEILEFLSKPVPFCRYCNVLNHSSGHPWKQSKKLIGEWS